jgi:hypothetical protein
MSDKTKTSNTEYLYLSGVCKWPRLATPDKDYDNYHVTLYLDEKSMKRFDESGLMLEPKTDEGGTSIKVRRPRTRVFNDELKEFGPPELIDENGYKVDPFKLGNGSTITVKLAVYPTKKGKGHRLEKVQVNELVPYVSNNGFKRF